MFIDGYSFKKVHSTTFEMKETDDQQKESQLIGNSHVCKKKLKINQVKQVTTKWPKLWNCITDQLKIRNIDKLHDLFMKNELKAFNEYFCMNEHIKKQMLEESNNKDFLYKHKLGITSIQVTNHEIITSSFDSKIYIYNFDNRKFKIYSGHSKGITDTFLFSKYLFSISYDQNFKIWNIEIDKCILQKKLTFVPIKVQIEFDKINRNKIRCSSKNYNNKCKKSKEIKETGLNIQTIYLTTYEYLKVFDINFNLLYQIQFNFIIKFYIHADYFIILEKNKNLNFYCKQTKIEEKVISNVIDFDVYDNIIFVAYSNQIEMIDLSFKISKKILNNLEIENINCVKAINQNSFYVLTTNLELVMWKNDKIYQKDIKYGGICTHIKYDNKIIVGSDVGYLFEENLNF